MHPEFKVLRACSEDHMTQQLNEAAKEGYRPALAAGSDQKYLWIVCVREGRRPLPGEKDEAGKHL
jgi:hypothetical protein